MKLVTFGINKERNLIVQFPIFYRHIDNNNLYQTEMAPVPLMHPTKRYNHIHIYK